MNTGFIFGDFRFYSFLAHFLLALKDLMNSLQKTSFYFKLKLSVGKF